MRQALKELRLGLDGALNISDKMENMMNLMVQSCIEPDDSGPQGPESLASLRFICASGSYPTRWRR